MSQLKGLHRREEVFQVCKVVATKDFLLSNIDILIKTFLFIANFDPKYVEVI
jgi:hypothetical protein